MKKVYKGIIEDNIIRFEEKIGLPAGTQALVALKTINKEEQEEIKNRQLNLLDKGFYPGKKLYLNREDLYENKLIDTNILVYAYDASEGNKHKASRKLLKTVWEEGGGIVCLQNLMEFFVVITKKVENPISIRNAKTIIEDIRFRWPAPILER